RSLSFIQGTAVNALRTTILFLMLYLIYAQEITVGQFFSLWIYSFFIFGPLQEMGTVINLYRETEVSLQNFQQILDIPKEPRPEQPVPLRSLEDLAFENVTFTHQTASQPAVRDISFRIERGRTLAFVGPSGAGKTTLVKLLVCDEATSSLDSLTEEEISHTIRDVAESRDVMSILIAHRLSTVMHADRIFVLERGQVVETGRHQELLDQTGLYYAMWRQQVGERRPAPAAVVQPTTAASV